MVVIPTGSMPHTVKVQAVFVKAEMKRMWLGSWLCGKVCRRRAIRTPMHSPFARTFPCLVTLSVLLLLVLL